MAEAPSRRRLAAILAADVVGYGRLMGRDGTGTLARLVAHRRELMEPLITAHGGGVIRLAADNGLCELASAVAAVDCAVAIQRGLAEREAGRAEDERIRLRIGLHFGDVVRDGGAVHGGGVTIAARLRALAEPGGVCLSGTVYDQAQGRTPHRFAALGERRLPNIESPVRIYAVILDMTAVAAGLSG